eukprot:4927935-Prymnesium_polylepis.1
MGNKEKAQEVLHEQPVASVAANAENSVPPTSPSTTTVGSVSIEFDSDKADTHSTEVGKEKSAANDVGDVGVHVDEPTSALAAHDDNSRPPSSSPPQKPAPSAPGG